MQSSTASPTEALDGDILRRKAAVAALIFLVSTVVATILFDRLDDLWPQVIHLEGATYFLLASVLGLTLAFSPLAAIGSLLLGTWWASESVFAPRRRPSPVLDRVLVAWGCCLTFAPSLAMLAVAVQAIFTGQVHFPQPPRDYFFDSEPLAFLQGLGFLLICAAGLGYAGWLYWHPKLSRRA
ncbi:MAG: hypothetical protein HGA47_02740 [Zoogloea sp.]|nr:hypothetical protein [Zoogloea sp.]